MLWISYDFFHFYAKNTSFKKHRQVCKDSTLEKEKRFKYFYWCFLSLAFYVALNSIRSVILVPSLLVLRSPRTTFDLSLHWKSSSTLVSNVSTHYTQKIQNNHKSNFAPNCRNYTVKDLGLKHVCYSGDYNVWWIEMKGHSYADARLPLNDWKKLWAVLEVWNIWWHFGPHGSYVPQFPLFLSSHQWLSTEAYSY